MKRLLILSILFMTYLISYADSTLSFDLPKDYIKKRNKKQLLLTIKIPAKLTSEDDQKLKTKKVDTSYVDMNPFAKVNIPIDYDKLHILAKKGLLSDTSTFLLNDRMLNTKYDFMNMISAIYNKIMHSDKEKLIENGVNADDIRFIKKLTKDFETELNSYKQLNLPSFYERLSLLTKKLKGGKGEVRVVDVQNEDDGSTILYLTLKENK